MRHRQWVGTEPGGNPKNGYVTQDWEHGVEPHDTGPNVTELHKFIHLAGTEKRANWIWVRDVDPEREQITEWRRMA